MLATAYGVTTDPTVNNDLDLIESDLKDAVTTAIGRLNAVLGSKPSDTRVLHANLADLHGMAAQIDRNKENRAAS